MNRIHYRSGYKYQLLRDYTVAVAVYPKDNIATQFIELDADGMLIIKAYYAWDGPSGPTIDTKNFMRGSLIHDALYQLMREEYIDGEQWREQADRELRKSCREDGMCWIRAWYVYVSVRWAAKPASLPMHCKIDECAP